MRHSVMALRLLGWATAAALASAPMSARAEDFESADAVVALVRALDNGGLTAIAAADPSQAGTFVAALYTPRSQLFVVSAHHPSVDGLLYRIKTQQYHDVYLDLQGTPTPAGRFFVMDADADGLLSARPNSGSVDVVFDGDSQVLCNGDAKSQHLTEDEYEMKVAAADVRYARLLRLLSGAAVTPER